MAISMETVTRVEKDPWFQYVKTSRRGRLRLFCLHYAGGGASIYRQWGTLLPPEIELYPIQLPGRENRWQEAPYTRVEELMQPLARGLLPYLDKPFVLFGHSMGALISFELTRYLRRHNLPMPLHLFASAHRAPQLPYSQEKVHALSQEEFLACLERLGTMSQEILSNEEAMEIYTPLLRADFSLCERYSYLAEPPLACSISAYGGLFDERVSRQEMAAWNMQSNGAFVLNMFPGDHFFLQSNQNLLLQNLSQILTRFVEQI